jgi:hypothetical protein
MSLCILILRYASHITHHVAGIDWVLHVSIHPGCHQLLRSTDPVPRLAQSCSSRSVEQCPQRHAAEP